MEELLPSLKAMLKKAIDIDTDALNLTITLTVKNKVEGIIAEPEEVGVMLKMYGGLTNDIPMEINIDNENQKIILKFQNEENYNEIAEIFKTIWDNAIDLLYQAIQSDFSRIKSIPDIDD